MVAEVPPSPFSLFSLVVCTPEGGTSSASPSEQSAPGRVVELMPASDRLPLESSNAAVCKKAPKWNQKPHVPLVCITMETTDSINIKCFFGEINLDDQMFPGQQLSAPIINDCRQSLILKWCHVTPSHSWFWFRVTILPFWFWRVCNNVLNSVKKKKGPEWSRCLSAGSLASTCF